MTGASRACLPVLAAFAMLFALAGATLLPMARETPARPLALPAPPTVSIDPPPDARVPLPERFTDDDGSPVTLGDVFGERPAVLVFGYYHCPNLCSTLMDGILESLPEVRLPAAAYRVIAVSIDPGESAAVAASKKASYAPLVALGGADLHLLTGTAPALDSLARSAGYRFVKDAASGEFAHPAGFIVAAPDGRITRVFNGVRFDARDVRLALVEAGSGRAGGLATLSDRLTLLCAHYDPRTGRYTASVMAIVRGVCLLLATLLAGWLWLRRPRGGDRA